VLRVQQGVPIGIFTRGRSGFRRPAENDLQKPISILMEKKAKNKTRMVVLRVKKPESEKTGIDVWFRLSGETLALWNQPRPIWERFPGG